jgi:anti-anti-sigma factor
MPREFEIDAYHKGRELLLILRGRLVLKYCPDTKSRLDNLFNPQIDQIYMYLGDMEFLDSAGLGVLVGLKMAANKNRTRLLFLSPPSRVDDIFRVSKLDTIFEVRRGAEVDVICATLRKDEFLLWSDNSDTGHGQFKTDPYHTPLSTRSNPTQFSTSSSDRSVEQEQIVRQLCTDAVEYIKQGDYEQATECYERALGIDSSNLSALNNLAIVYEKKPEWYARAVDIWNRVLAVSNTHGDDKHGQRAQKHLDSLSKLMKVE